MPRKKNINNSASIQETAREPFPVVGIGASAGGIEAITRLVGNLAPNLGMAYVVVQHLSPTHESILPELIERKTRMKVHQVTDGIHIHPDSIYVIPPNALMSIVDGKLTLSPHAKSDGNIHSIDFFLSALANVYKEKAVAIILSGTATDGTEGVKAIKDAAGITFAQDNSAKFPGMPHSAIDSGFVDIISSPENIADELGNIARVEHSISSGEELIRTQENELKKIFELLHNKYTVDFIHYKPNTISRRIFRRMTLNKIANAGDYITILENNSEELDLLYRDLLISVTSFFRDPELYITLSKKIFPELLRNRHSAEAMRIWIPACASGEEACSVAISLFEYLGDRAMVTPIQIFATDLSESAIQKARTGIYSKSILNNVSRERLSKFFIKIDDSYQVIKPIRDICIYATHNLLKDPPFSRMDIISCQNVMIYLGSTAQHKILQSFHYALNPLGYLMLGKSEGISNASDLFVQSEKGSRIFTKTSNPTNLKYEFSLRHELSLPASLINDSKHLMRNSRDETDIGKEADKLLLSRFVPASIVVNRDFHIIRFQGDIANYLQPAAGKASLHVLKMVKDEIMFDLRSLLNKAKKNNTIAKKDGISMTINNLPAKVSIEIIPTRQIPDYFLIVFQEKAFIPVTISRAKGPNINNKDYQLRLNEQLEIQLKESKEQTKIVTEEFEYIREQLQSSHEEVLSSNEELQSMNEELETSKEELQSTNEELTTINEEVLRRNEDLKRAVDYTETIIESIREPLIVLNNDMKVLTVNKAFLTHFKLKKNETEGENFYEMANGQWNIKKLKSKLQDIISKQKSFENFELIHQFGEINKTLLFNAARMDPDDKKNNRYLLVIEDITLRRQSEELLKENEERLRLLIQNAFDIITILSPEGKILYESESILQVLGYKPHERLNKNIFIDSIVHPDDKLLKRRMFEKALNNPNENVRGEFRLIHKDGGYRVMEAVYINLLDDLHIRGIIANYRDITERRALEKQKDQFIGIASHELKTPVTSIKGYAQILEQILADSPEKEPVELLHKMETQINRLTNLIKDLLDVTQISDGELRLKKNNININDLISEVINEVPHLSVKHKIKKELEPVKNITSDEEKVRQVLINLISNAVKYSPNADKIIVRSTDDADGVTVSVQDFGIGITEDDQKKIFARFFRVPDPSINTFPGLGLGLYISAEIIKKLGGKIWVKSEKNKGAEFSFFLPGNKVEE